MFAMKDALLFLTPEDRENTGATNVSAEICAMQTF